MLLITVCLCPPPNIFCVFSAQKEDNDDVDDDSIDIIASKDPPSDDDQCPGNNFFKNTTTNTSSRHSAKTDSRGLEREQWDQQVRVHQSLPPKSRPFDIKKQPKKKVKLYDLENGELFATLQVGT